MKRAVAVLLILRLLASSAPVRAQGGSNERHSTGTVTRWTALGAGAGFGAGAYLAVVFFDDAVDSDRKLWTSAIAGSIVGGIAGYLIGRHRSRPRPSSAAGTMDSLGFQRVVHSQSVLQQSATSWRPDHGLGSGSHVAAGVHPEGRRAIFAFIDDTVRRRP